MATAKTLSLALALLLSVPAIPLLTSDAAEPADVGPAVDTAMAAPADHPRSEAGPAIGPDASSDATSFLSRVAFEENVGQFQEGVRFVTRLPGGEAALYDDRIVARGLGGSEVVLLLGGSATPVGTGAQEGTIHRYTGDIATTAQRFDEVHYPTLHDGIDLRVYANDGTMEFDHIVAPGADATAAGFTVAGATPAVTADGALALGDALRLDAPFAFQEGPDGREPVDVAFDVDGQHVAYALGAYDAARPLVIDPAYRYASFAGGSSSDYGYEVDVMPHPTDPYTTLVALGGYSYSSSFKTGAANFTYGSSSSYDFFVMRMEYDTEARVMSLDWLAFIGSSSSDYLRDVKFDSNGGVLFAGYVYGDSFPAVKHIQRDDGGLFGQPAYNGSTRASTDAAVGWLDAAGGLQFSSYLGGYSSDYAYGITEVPGGRIGITGYTYSTSATTTTGITFPVSDDAWDAPVPGVSTGTDAFYTLIEPDWNGTNARIVYSTLLMGSSTEYAYDIAADSMGVYLTGYTSTSPTSAKQFPTTAGSWDDTRQNSGSKGWAARWETGVGDPLWVTFIGDDQGSGTVYGQAVAPTGNGSVWVGGYTYSDFPTCSWCALPAFQAARAGGYDGYVVHLKPDGTNITYASFMGGTSSDYLNDIDYANGLLAIGGDSYSATSWSSLPAPVTGSTGSGTQPWAVRLDTRTGLPGIFGHYGSASTEYADGIAIDHMGQVYSAGYTYSSSFPTMDALQGSSGGGTDAFLTIIGKAAPLAVIQADASYVGHPIEDTNSTNLYEVLTWTDVSIHGLNSTPGDHPLASNFTWEYYDDAGTLLGTETGVTTPSFSPLNRTDDTEVNVCLTVWDTGPEPFDNKDTACMLVRWLNRPPVAIPDPTPTRIPLGTPFDFTESSTDLDGTIVNVTWDFGDSAGVAYGTNASYNYTSTGTYTVTMNVTDDDGAWNLTTFDIEVVEGPAAFFSFPSGLRVGDTVPFTDLSMEGDNPITEFTWDFGDGSPPLTRFTGGLVEDHDFPGRGPYNVTLTVKDEFFVHSYSLDVLLMYGVPTGTPDRMVTTQNAPVALDAGLLANDLSPDGADLWVDAYTQPPTGEGIVTLIDDVPTYTPPYNWTGTTSFTYDLADLDNKVGPIDVEVVVLPWKGPTADFTMSIYGQQVVFEDRSRIGSSPIVDWSWDFHDGALGEGRVPFHGFDVAGHHLVTLTVVDEYGLSSSVTKPLYLSSSLPTAKEGYDVPEVFPELIGAPVVGNTVFLDAGARPGLQYSWRQTTGPLVALRGADTAQPSFVVPHIPGGATLAFEVIAYDGTSFSEAAEVAFSVAHENRPPVVHVLPDERTAGLAVPVEVIGKARDPDGDALELRWTQQSGPRVDFEDNGAGTLRFVAPARAGTAVFELIANDGVATSSAQATVHLTGRAGPDPFFNAIASPTGQVRFVGAAPGLSYMWDFGDASAISHASAPMHQYTEDGTYRVKLVVTDDAGREGRMERLVDVTIDPEAFIQEPASSSLPPLELQDTPHDDVRPASVPMLGLVVLVVAAVLAAAAGLALVLRRR